ncbi:hypothetical protein [Clostridium culturomicium]|uniref:hypothetical protein n=1 Tax=Clostridium culturomicium TaxID=1499683 RepID=UPI0038575766
MNKFDWEKFRNERVAVNCRTEEAAKEFIKECYKRDMKWYRESMNTTYYNSHKEETAYAFKFGLLDKLGYADTHWYKKAGYEIVEYTSEKKQTELTFQEVIASIKPGELYVECVKNEPFQVTVSINSAGRIALNCFKDERPYMLTTSNGFSISKDTKFELYEKVNKYILFEVVHAVGGKHYTFRASDNENLKPRDFVICDTSMGKTFGRVAGSITKELTEKEYMEYKECWRGM